MTLFPAPPAAPRAGRSGRWQARLARGMAASALLARLGWPNPAGAQTSQPGLPDTLLQNIAWPRLLELLAGTVFLSALAATIIGCLVITALTRRGLLRPLSAALDGMEGTASRLAAIAARAEHTHNDIDAGADAARVAARDTETALAALTDTQARLRRWLNSAEADHVKASMLADQCARFTEVMPELLAGAVDSMQARGLAEMNATAARLRQSAVGIEGAASILQTRIATLEVAASQNDADLAERETAEREAWAARQDESVARIEAAAAALHGGVAVLARTAQQQAALHTHAAQLASLCERLASELPPVAGDAIGNIEAMAQTLLAQIATQSEAHSARLDQEILQAAARLQDGIAAASAIQATHQAADSDTNHRIASLETCLTHARQATQDWEAVARSMSGSAAGWPACLQAIQTLGARAEDVLDTTLRALATEQEQAPEPTESPAAAWARHLAETLPGIAAQIEAASAAVAGQAAALAHVQDRLEVTQSDQMTRIAAVLAPPVASLATMCQRADQTLAALNDAGTQLAAEATRQASSDSTGEAIEALGSHLARTETVAARLALHGDRLAGLLDAGEQTACRLAIAAEAAMLAAATPNAALQSAPESASERAAQTYPEATEAALKELIGWTERVTSAAQRVIEGAETQERATARVADAILALEAASGPRPAPSPGTAPGIQATLHLVHANTASLQTAASLAAQAAMRGQPNALAADLGGATPDMLAAIDQSIRHLQGAATALAIASDAVARAA